MTVIDKLSNILKTFYLPPIRSQLNTATVLLDKIRAGSEQVSGQDIVTPLMFGYSQGVGARNESDDLPTARKTLYSQSSTRLKANYGRVQLSGHLIRATRDDRGSFVRAIGSEIQNMVDGLKQDYNRQCFGLGTGELAESTTGSATGETSMAVDTSQYMKYDMPVVAYSNNGATYRGNFYVRDLPTATSFLTSTNTNAVSDDDKWYRGEGENANSKDKEIMGLRGLVDTTSALQNINPSGTTSFGQGDSAAPDPDTINSWWAAAKKDTTAEALSLDKMQDCFTEVEKKAGSTNLVITTYALRDKYATLLESNRRYVNVMELESGFRALEYNGQPLVPDKDCPDKHMFFLDTSVMSFQKKGDWDWMDMDGAIWSRVTNKEAYEATIVLESNLVTAARNRSAVITAAT